MKNAFKFFIIIAITVIIGFSFVGCFFNSGTNNDNDDNGEDGSGSGGSGGSGVNPTITIKNNTGYSVNGINIKKSTSTSWGDNLCGWYSLDDGTTRQFTLSQSLSANKEYDFILQSSSGGYSFRKYKVTVSNGMTIAFTVSDINDGSDLPRITIQNRTGVAFNGCYIKPSSSSDWGGSFGEISNNSDRSVTIPIPPSSYKKFDIQTRSSNPTNTYTMSDITVSDGMVLTYTNVNSDTSLIGSPVIVIENKTSYSVSGIYIKKTTSTNWGDNLCGWYNLDDGTSRTFTLSQALSANSEYDFVLQSSSGGYSFRKYKVTVSNGMIIPFTTNDLNDGSDLPGITIQNRTGVAFNGCYIKPSSSSDWGESFGTISNNDGRSVTIPIPPSSYTVFDLQMRSSNPTNTFTMSNITVSAGMVLTYTRANSDTPLIGSPVIVIENKTTYSISGIYIKLSSSESWGDNLCGWYNLDDGTSRTFTLSQSLSANSIYDFKLQSSSGGYVFTKINVSVSDGMIVSFSGSDLQ
ncbi:hypothetical protein R84B8_01858 [Treponema sp. R8-4-B8]